MFEDFVSYQQAVKLRECGFNELTNSFYDECSAKGECEIVPTYADFNEVGRTPGCECVSAPSLAQAQKWLREVINMAVYVAPDIDEADIGDTPTPFPTGDWCYEIWFGDYTHIWPLNPYPTYEQALSAGIDAALELIEKKGEK